MVEHYYTLLDRLYQILADCYDNFDVYKRMSTTSEAKKLYSMDSCECISVLRCSQYYLDDLRTQFFNEDDNWDMNDPFLTATDRLQEDIIELATDFVIHAVAIRDDYCLINHCISQENSNQIRLLNKDYIKRRDYVRNLLFQIGF